MIKKDTIVYAVKHKDKNVLEKSSSGGLFTALTDVFLNSGNAVASCIYNYENDKVEFKLYEDLKTRDCARGSKYIQATVNDGYRKINEWIKMNPGKKIIAFGTGCQMAGLKKYLELQKNRDKVIIVDIICHGATSPGLWNKYLEYKNIRGNIDFLSFKDKRNGWHNPTVFAKVNNEEISIKDFSEFFYGGWALRHSCYKCPYTKIERDTDITIGDFWGIENVNHEFANNMGVSLALIHTQKGQEIFESIKDSVEYYLSDKKSCLQPRLILPAEKPANRLKFWEDLNKKGVKFCLKKYKRKEESIIFKFINRFKSKIKKILNIKEKR